LIIIKSATNIVIYGSSFENNKHNIIKYNSEEVGQTFIQYFYSSWLNDPQVLIYSIITLRTKIKYNNVIYEYTDIIHLLNQLKSNGLEISVSKHEILDSNSRQIYILVKGIIKNSQSTNTFTQTFVLIYTGKSTNNQWNLINSILIIE
jgi:hypothetical protein